MIKAKILIDGIEYEAEVEDVQTFGLDQKLALVRVLDGRKPFEAHVARSDPEETPVPYTRPVDWGWIELSAIKSAEAFNADGSRYLDPVYDMAGYEVRDDTRTDVGL